MTEQEQLTEIKKLFEPTNQRIDHLAKAIEDLKQETAQTNDRVETYQKASQQVVNLAFGLIVATTAAIVIPAVVGR